MASPDYAKLVAGQRAYFLSGATRPAAWRVGAAERRQGDDQREPRRAVRCPVA